ncbi:MAG TPA: MFS transporter [Chloroflexota bacterium]
MLRNRSLLAISVVVAITFIGIGMVVPVRILYAQSRGASLAVIGAMASAFLLTNFLCQYPVGLLADLWGRRRLMILGLAGQAALGLVYLTVSDPLEFVALRCLEGALSASVLPAARALVADSVPPEQRGQAYGIFGSFLNAGFLLGPALGGLLATSGYAGAFIGSCLFRVLALAIVLVLVRDERRTQPEERARARSVPRRALLTAPLLGAYILAFGDNLYFGFDLTLMPLWMHDHLGAPVVAIGLAYAIWAFPNIIGAPLGGRIADRFRRSGLILASGLAQVPLYTAYGLAGSIGPAIIVFGVHGAVYGLMQPAVDATLATASPPDARARVQGLYSAVGLASAFIAANSFGTLYSLNFRLPLFVMAGGFGLCVLVGGTLIRRSEPAL